ncbi:MAG: prenyltransferase/squalene oxidase repeat-containing protein [Planctomycetota bacterium]
MRGGARPGLLLALLATTVRAQDVEVPAHPRHVNEQTREAIKRGLDYLVREQGREGSWRSAGGHGSYPLAMTGLAGLALVGSGSTPTRGLHARAVRKAASYVLSQQQPNGLITSPQEEGRSMYGHGFSTLFLAQVYGMEEDVAKQAAIAHVLRRAIELTARSQSGAGGWIYAPDQGGDEGSVTVTQVQALRACRNAGIHVPRSVIDKAIKYIEQSQEPDGGVAYSVHSRGSRPAITAAACAVLYNAGVYDSAMAEKAFKYAWTNCQPTQSGDGHYFYTQLYMSQACWQKGDRHWNEYYPAIRDRLLALQGGNGAWNGDGAGQVYGTAVALLILQIPYNQLPILSR